MSGAVKEWQPDTVLLDDLSDAVLEVSWDDVFDFTSQGQREFTLGSSRPYQGWIGARGTGKSLTLARKGLFLAMKNGPPMREDGSFPERRGLLLGRTADEVENKIVPYLEDAVRDWRAETGIPLIASYSASDRAYTLVNGFRIFLRSYGSPKVLKMIRGWTADFIGADEVAFAEIDPDKLEAAAINAIRESEWKSKRRLARESARGNVVQLGVKSEKQFFWTSSPDGDRGLVGKYIRKHRAGDLHYALWSTSIFDCEHIGPEDIERRKAASTPETWAEEALGLVLRPSHVVYPRYREDVHVLMEPWRPDPTHYWGIGIDWGEAKNGFFCFVDIDPMTGRWVVFHEFKSGKASALQFRAQLATDIDRWRRILHRPPDIIGSDRALTHEHKWVDATYGETAQFGTGTNKSQDEQRRATGIRILQWMMSPLVGRPRLYLAATRMVDGAVEPALRGGLLGDEMGLRDALAAYRYQLRLVEGVRVPTSRPESNTPPTHPCDGLRYLVLVSRDVPELHGGTEISDLIDEEVRRTVEEEAA